MNMKHTPKTSLTAVLIYVAAILASIAVVSSCIHEYPVGPGVDPTMIVVNIDLTTDPAVAETSTIGRSDEDGCMYFIMEIYRNDFTGDPVSRLESGAVRAEDGSSSVRFTDTLHAGNYKVAAFAVCTKDMQGGSSVYDMSDLSRIVFDDTYQGSISLKECYEARFDLNISSDEWFTTMDVAETMHSPMGRVEAVSTDAAEFLQNMTMDLPEPPGADFWEQYTVRWDYALYFPTGYNVLTGLPNKAETAIYFTSAITPVTEDEVLLGYDYVFVNGESTTLNITLTVMDAEGEVVNSYSGLEARILKGQTTVLRGTYLTEDRGSGVGIDPGFDGYIDITLPD